MSETTRITLDDTTFEQRNGYWYDLQDEDVPITPVSPTSLFAAALDALAAAERELEELRQVACDECDGCGEFLLDGVPEPCVCVSETAPYQRMVARAEAAEAELEGVARVEAWLRVDPESRSVNTGACGVGAWDLNSDGDLDCVTLAPTISALGHALPESPDA